jgi:arsenate reductase-like glutaredoxin family protein
MGVTEGDSRPAQLRVRPSKIREALRWLERNNIYYQHISVSNTNLAALDQNPDLSSLLTEQALPSGAGITEHGPADSDLTETYFPHVPNIDQQAVIQNLRASQGHQVDWPAQDPIPINEFNTDGYMAQAFPTLFPFGRADYNAERNVKLTLIEYFQFLMRYRDGRFAQHARFRFFAMNTVLRWQALNYAKIYIQRNRFNNMTVQEVMNLIESDPCLRGSIMVYAGHLRSTTPYWKRRCGELLDMVSQLGSPTIFFTLSAADYHWNKLFKLLAPGSNVETLPEITRRQLMHSNPLITAEFFKKRVEIFRRNILKPICQVKDFWMRYEWQFRGSPHVHGILWLTDAPDLSSLSNTDAPQTATLLAFCDKLTKAWNPDSTVCLVDTHPCRKRFTDVEDHASDLNLLLNTVQRHTRCGRHCMRKKRNSPVLA